MAIFKTRARALDLLGRQQIAGIPTAINELIKNAHDAYADRFDVDFLRKENLIILRDDGMGMTKNDFESRWLTIGTESKLTKDINKMPLKDPEKPTRPIMGEKGIGRLAIASIGKQVLVATKAKKRGGSNKVITAFINWELFELPYVNLDDIDIPIAEFDDIPEPKDIERLKHNLLLSVAKIYSNKQITEEVYSHVCRDIESFPSQACTIALPSKFDITGDNGGTFFYVSPVNDTIILDIEGTSDKTEATKIEKMLIGFHNTMTPDHPNSVINITFRDHKGIDGSYTTLVENNNFFTPEDFDMADHHFSGIFDEFGQFNGTIKIYDEKTFNHVVSWNENHFKETLCGPFKINLAYIQGKQSDSRIDSINYATLTAKSDKFGGLYIYRDNIRILPYGNSDYDFLDIEKNRSKRASTYFFSYRRMFGVVEITHEKNANLIEKAGREGFIENKAYLQLQSILKNFFLQIAGDFFDDKSKSITSEFYNLKKNEINKTYKILARREKLSRTKKEKFLSDLDNFFKNLSSGKFKNDFEAILQNVKENFDSILLLKDHDEISSKIIEYESQGRSKILAYSKEMEIVSPKGFILSRDRRSDWELYLSEFQSIKDELISNAYEKISNYVEYYKSKLNVEINKRKRLEYSLNSLATTERKTNQKKRSQTNEVVSDISKKVKEITKDLIFDLDSEINTIREHFNKLSFENSEDVDLVKERTKMENDIEKISRRNTDIMERIIRQFESFYLERSDDGEIITNDQIADTTSEELENLQEKLLTDVELSQLGLAVGILNHEFNSTIQAIRGSIRDLKAWSEVNTNLDPLYNNIKVNFEHLDSYLNLFTPLSRRLNRRREEIPLIEIKTFLIDLFKQRLDRHNIKFKHTNAFASGKIFGFKSVFYPAFVNIIDNAIYWLKQSESQNRTIRLHYENGSVYISNNGPEIKYSDKEKIFQLGFSRKPNGRGMGLSITRDVLNGEDYEISVDTPQKDSTVTFKISKK